MHLFGGEMARCSGFYDFHSLSKSATPQNLCKNNITLACPGNSIPAIVTQNT